jgi:hypothetical protein
MIRRVQRSGRIFYYYVTKHPERKEIPLGSNLKYALKEYARITAGESFGRMPVPSGFERVLFRLVRKNVAARGIAVQINDRDIRAMLDRADGACEISGLRFDFRPAPEYRIRPWMPSVDRVDSAKPYTPGNCRIVCAAVNLALNQFGEDVLLEIASGILRKKTGRCIPGLRSAPQTPVSDLLVEEQKIL